MNKIIALLSKTAWAFFAVLLSALAFLTETLSNTGFADSALGFQ